MIAEVALTVVVLTGTGLLWREFTTLRMLDLVATTDGVVTFQIACRRRSTGPTAIACGFSIGSIRA